MMQRLVWNFSIVDENQLDIPGLPHEEQDELRWESRFFYPHDRDISLFGLTEDCLDLSVFKTKRRLDTYYLLPDSSCNIKERRGELLYKPQLGKTDFCTGFGKKINLAETATDVDLPGDPCKKAGDLLAELHQYGQQILVEKSALVYKFSTQPTIKLELARLLVNKSVYFSVCIEGRSPNLVNLIARHLIKQGDPCDYVTFLKQTSQPC